MNFDRVSWKRAGARFRGCQRAENTFGGFTRAAVRGCEEAKGVVGPEQGAEFEAGDVRLAVTFGGKFDAVVGRVLVDGAVLVAFGLGVAN